MNCIVRYYVDLLLTFTVSIAICVTSPAVASTSISVDTISQHKLLPSPEGIGGKNDYVGRNVAIDGNLAVVSAPGMRTGGGILVYRFNGEDWVRTAVIRPQKNSGISFLGNSVDVLGNRVVAGAIDGRYYCVVIFEFENNTWVEKTILKSSVAEELSGFGNSVSLSGDRLLVGEPLSNVPFTSGGAAYLFDYNGENWVETVRFHDSATFSRFGHAVSLDGDRALIGAHGHSFSNIGIAGAAFMYEFNGAEWVETQMLTASHMSGGDFFGFSVSLQGERALIGAGNARGLDNTHTGSVYYFAFENESWVQKQEFFASDPTQSNRFGHSVSMYGDRALIGDTSGTVNDIDVGSAYVFSLDGQSWHQEYQLLAPDGQSLDKFGWSVALSDGHAFIGADKHDPHAEDSGAAYVFKDDGQEWIFEDKISFLEGAKSDAFGTALSVSGDWALVGAIWDNNGAIGSGAAYIFNYNNNWELAAKLIAPNVSQNDHFGYAVSLLHERALVSQYKNPVGAKYYGAVNVYNFDGEDWNATDQIISLGSSSSDEFGHSLAQTEDFIFIGAPGTQTDNSLEGEVHVYEFDGISWVENSRISASDGHRFSSFGYSLSANNDRLLVGAIGMEGMNGNTGAVYEFQYNGQQWVETVKIEVANGIAVTQFGYSLAMNEDTVLIGSYNNGVEPGLAIIFNFDGNSWLQSHEFSVVDNDEAPWFGSRVALMGQRALVSAVNPEFPTNAIGAVYVFEDRGGNWTQTLKINTPDRSFGYGIGNSLGMTEDFILIGDVYDDERGSGAGAVYVFEDAIFEGGFNQ